MEKMKLFIIESKDINRDSYLWNMIGSLLMAFQSVIMLMILTRTVGIAEAGIFTIAYANANLFLTIGKYGMRNFQVSDVKNKYSFSEYLCSRKITFIAMIIVSVVYVAYTAIVNSYTFEKSMTIIFMCFFKSIDSIEDIYFGMYQKQGRLDIASKIMTLRLAFTIVVFGCGVIIFQNQLLTLVIVTLITSFLLFLFIRWTYPLFDIQKDSINSLKLWELIKSCFPLFIGTFLSFYIGNAPKYAIDSTLSDELQACYGFIAMPVFVIGLLNSFIFNPKLFRLSCMWEKRESKLFIKHTGMQIAIIIGITTICILGAYLFGIPVLSFMYNTNLQPYKSELIILLIGGGFLGMSGLLNAVITIIRFQKWLAWGYAVVAALAFFLSDSVVKQYEMMGAAVLYTVLMAMLSVCFLIFFFIGVIIKREKKYF